MDPLTGIALAIQLAGGLASFFANKSGEEQARILSDKNFKDWMELNIPDPKDQYLVLTELKSAGDLKPEVNVPNLLNENPYDNVQENPDYKNVQLRALQALQDKAYSGGLDLTDRALLNNLHQENSQRAKSARDTTLASADRQGTGNSGKTLEALLMFNQQQADRDARSSMDTASHSQQRALEAIMQAANLGGTLQNQEMNQKNKSAAARDEISKFNMRNLQSVQNRNTDIRNSAAKENLMNRQNIENMNVNNLNRTEAYNKGLYQKEFENKAERLRGASNANNQNINSSRANAATTGNLFENLGNAGGKIVNGIREDEYRKKKLERLGQNA